jgi:hypothetical protein
MRMKTRNIMRLVFALVLPVLQVDGLGEEPATPKILLNFGKRHLSGLPEIESFARQELLQQGHDVPTNFLCRIIMNLDAVGPHCVVYFREFDDIEKLQMTYSVRFPTSGNKVITSGRMWRHLSDSSLSPEQKKEMVDYLKRHGKPLTAEEVEKENRKSLKPE